MKRWLVILAVLALSAAVAHAQDSYLSRSGLDMFGGSTERGSAGGGSHSMLGLLGSGHLKITNEASFSVFSGAGGSLTQGLNVTRLSYQAGGPLSLSVGMGTLFMSSGSFYGYSANPGIYLHDVSARYQVGDHSIITFQYQRAPGTWDRRLAPPGSGYGLTDYPLFPR